MLSHPLLLAITGGPCAGKTSVLEALRESYGHSLRILPEVSTLLLSNGFPRPGIDVPADDAWQRSFQGAVLPLQKSLEEAYLAMASSKNIPLLIADRGMLDGAAYMPGGEKAFLETFALDKTSVYSRYTMIIQLSSVASCQPELWESLKASNPVRYESLEEAQERDRRLQAVWKDHPNYQLIPGEHGLETVLASVLELVKPYLH